jgi:hypothetical protein
MNGWNRVAKVALVGIACLVSSGGVKIARGEPGQAASPQQAAPVAAADPLQERLGQLATAAIQKYATARCQGRSEIEELRGIGQPAVDFLLKQPELQKLPHWSDVLDRVAQQKDAKDSGLFWHTNLDEALAVAKREGKPLLSLRLLGKLTDELSCANSRFFRTTLYPHASVRDLLAQRFVLHWQTVREVPIITIDLGHGRKIRRTITGNSLHLILDSQGRTVEILPGLYAAEPFAERLRDAEGLTAELAALNDWEFKTKLAAWHDQARQSAIQRWSELCRAAGLDAKLAAGVDHPSEVWTRIAQSLAGKPVLDEATRRAVLERAAPVPAEMAMRLARAKAVVETPAMRLVRNVSQVIQEDSLKNEYDFHVQIHNWFVMIPYPADRDAIVGRVYSELFLSPLDDPWFGLSRPDMYSALQNDGRLDAVTADASR